MLLKYIIFKEITRSYASRSKSPRLISEEALDSNNMQTGRVAHGRDDMMVLSPNYRHYVSKWNR